MQNNLQLFRGFSFVLYGKFMRSSLATELAKLIEHGGGRVRDSLPLPDQSSTLADSRWVLVHDDTVGKPPDKIAQFCRDKNIPVVTCIWLFNCVSHLQVVPFPGEAAMQED